MSEKGQPKRFCRFCGSELKEGARFCTACGKKVAEDTVQKQKKVQKDPETAPQHPVQSKKSKGVMICAVLVIVALVVIGVMIFLIKNGLDQKADADQGDNRVQSERVVDTEQEESETTDKKDSKDKDKKDKDRKDKEKLKDTEESTQSAVKEANLPGIGEEFQNADYILPTSNSQYLTEADLEGLTKEECRLARNEIYARHGRLFLDEELQKYFDAKPWYHGTIQPDDFQDTMLNDYEMKNKDLIVQYESEHFNN